MGGDQHVVGTDRRAGAFECGAQFAVAAVGLRLQREDRQRGKDRFELLGQSR